VGLLRLITIWPFDEKIIAGLAGKGARFLVPEMNLGQLAGLVKAAAGGAKTRSFTQVNGTTISPAGILGAIMEVI
jgi:2-oxoglutarate ferredoxin oxidoreductase subunit alpha